MNVVVYCEICGYEDIAYWNEFGATQPCLDCDAAPVFLSNLGEIQNANSV